jgi:hypothetical protein
MIWIFAAVVLVLAVFNEGFRKLVYACGIIAVLGVFTMLCFANADHSAKNWSPPEADFAAYRATHSDNPYENGVADGVKIPESAKSFREEYAKVHPNQ